MPVELVERLLPSVLEEARRIGHAVDDVFAFHLPIPGDARARLFEAMRYAALGGGKRLRPFLVLESARLFGVDPACALRAAAAI